MCLRGVFLPVFVSKELAKTLPALAVGSAAQLAATRYANEWTLDTAVCS